MLYKNIEDVIIKKISNNIVINISLNKFLILFNSSILVSISPVVLDLITSKGRLII